MIAAINPKVLFNINEQSAHIDKTLPHEVFQLVLRAFSQKDKVSSIRVSKYWQYMTLEVVRGQNNSSLMLFGERMLTIMHDKFPHLCPEFSKLTSDALLASSNLAECHELVIKRREEMINFLTKLSFDELNQLRLASQIVRKPRFYETIFDLTKLYKEFPEKPVTSDSNKACLYNVCLLGGFDKALASVEIIFSKCLFFHFIAKEFCINGNPEKALAVASRTSLENQLDIMIKLFGMGANEQGNILGNKIKTWVASQESGNFEQLMSWLNLMQNGKFKSDDWVMEDDKLITFSSFKQSAILESANNLITEGRLVEADKQASRYDDCQFNFNLARKYIELDKWYEFPRWRVWRMNDTLAVPIARTLYSYYKFTEAAKICVAYELDLTSTHEIYQAMQEEKFDEVMIIADRVPHYETTLGLSKKLAEKGQIEKAYKLVDKIQDYKMKHEALKFINAFL